MDKLLVSSLRNLPIEIKHNGISHFCNSEDGYIDISFTKNTPITDENVISIGYKGHIVMEINLLSTKELCDKVKLVNGITARGFNENQRGELYPVNPTRVFYINDSFIVLFLELNNITSDFPINVELINNCEIVYSHFDIIPASLQNDGHKTYIHTIKIDKDSLPHNKSSILNFNLSVKTITINTIYEQQIAINCIETRPNRYSQQSNISSGYNFNINL
ncbi:MAG: hypothetical protein K0R84_617 [Clostridia bacterium]|jgi:hypothetical protein|nr:hypothetical protein [Clostridia bacterium]